MLVSLLNRGLTGGIVLKRLGNLVVKFTLIFLANKMIVALIYYCFKLPHDLHSNVNTEILPAIMVKNPPVKIITVDSEQAGLRLDKFLLQEFKQVPKSRVYKALRKGEVRVNKGRAKAEYRLANGDLIRVPPLRQEINTVIALPVKPATLALLAERILYENEHFMVLNKPAGMAVHGGSGIQHGIIEAMRELRPELKNLELVHRLDRDTSGCLLLAKKSSTLRQLHTLFRNHKVNKMYLCLCKGRWRGDMHRVKSALLTNQLRSGERVVQVNEQGKASLTIFRVLQRFAEVSLMSAELATGRTHQIRVHANSVKHPLAGDERYGNQAFNQHMKQRYDLRRLFLHAHHLEFISPVDGENFVIEAPLEKDLAMVLSRIKAEAAPAPST